MMCRQGRLSYHREVGEMADIGRSMIRPVGQTHDPDGCGEHKLSILCCSYSGLFISTARPIYERLGESNEMYESAVRTR